jgi:hypothetical protein
MRALSSVAYLLFGAALASCNAPANAHSAPRCDVGNACPADLVCHAGFCIPPGDAIEIGNQVTVDSFSASDASVSDDAGTSVPAKDPSSPPDEGDDTSQKPTPSGQSVAWCEALCCNAALTVCSNACKAVLSSQASCGKCSDECEPGKVCLGGECCEADESLCDGECTDTSADKHHCGGCGNTCTRGPCKDGICEGDP